MPSATRDAFSADLRLAHETVRAGVIPKTARASDKHWERWAEYCHQHRLDPFLRHTDDPVPFLQVFAERYRDGRIAPSNNTARSRTVEGALRAVGQKFTSLGAWDIRKDATGAIDFRLQRMLKAYKRQDLPPTRVKPLPITIVLFLLQRAYGRDRYEDRMAIADMICVAFFFLLRPGEYTGTTTDNAAFQLADIALYVNDRQLDIMTAAYGDIENATSVGLIFTTQKNGVRNEKIMHGTSGHPLCCPVQAIIRRILHPRRHKAKNTTQLASYYKYNRKY